MKVFVSQPFHGIREEEVMKRRAEILMDFELQYLNTPDWYEVIDQYYVDDAPEDADRTWYLGRSIQLMGTADIVIFSKDYQKAKGCEVEFQVCKLYGIPYYIER